MTWFVCSPVHQSNGSWSRGKTSIGSFSCSRGGRRWCSACKSENNQNMMFSVSGSGYWRTPQWSSYCCSSKLVKIFDMHEWKCHKSSYCPFGSDIRRREKNERS